MEYSDFFYSAYKQCILQNLRFLKPTESLEISGLVEVFYI
jgi:hypothetical protein